MQPQQRPQSIHSLESSSLGSRCHAIIPVTWTQAARRNRCALGLGSSLRLKVIPGEDSAAHTNGRSGGTQGNRGSSRRGDLGDTSQQPLHSLIRTVFTATKRK